MHLILTTSTEKTELSALSGTFNLIHVQNAARKAILGLGDNLKGIGAAKLVKIYLTGKGGAGRAIFLIEVVDNDAVLLLLRHKNDKKIGSNMSFSNPHFKELLAKRISQVFEELKTGDYEEYEL